MTSFAFMLVEVPGTALDDVDDELVVQVAAAHVEARLGDGVDEVGLEQPELSVGLGGRLLHRTERRHEVPVPRQGDAADREVVERAGGVDALVGGRGHRPVAEEVVLGARALVHEGRHRSAVRSRTTSITVQARAVAASVNACSASGPTQCAANSGWWLSAGSDPIPM